MNETPRFIRLLFTSGGLWNSQVWVGYRAVHRAQQEHEFY
jgi:hypothetical protein